jgi:ADP-dependent NAD(P)H-hydrate dehydratase
VRPGQGAGRGKPIRITQALLRDWPLPLPSSEADKDERGRLLVIAGADDVPGAAILAADAALRSGVGKLCIASPRSVARWIAQAVPEARVVALDGRRASRPRNGLQGGEYDAILIGPGMQSSDSLTRRVTALARLDSTLVLDAGAIDSLAHMKRAARVGGNGASHTARCIITPHAGEMAKLAKLERDDVEANARDVAVTFARTRNVVVVLKGPKTFIAEPRGDVWLHDRGNVGLAVSGSGDCLAGIVAGLAARGASSAQAAVWGVALHGLAGARLTARYGPLGALAREIPHLIPELMEAARVARRPRQSARRGRAR